MGLDITVLIVDWSWLGEVPSPERLSRLRDAWSADETGLWDPGAPVVEGDWEWPRGRAGAFFAVYEFQRSGGSFTPHFWAGQRWEHLRDHADALVRADLDALLLDLIWDGPDGEAQHRDRGFFGAVPGASCDPLRGLLTALSPAGVRESAARWERVRPRLDGLRGAFVEHAAGPEGRVCDFEGFTDLLEDWGRVLTEAARRGWGVVALSE